MQEGRGGYEVGGDRESNLDLYRDRERDGERERGSVYPQPEPSDRCGHCEL